MKRPSNVAAITALFVCLISASAALVAQGESRMDPKVVNESGFTIVGIEARTSYAKESSPDGIIGKQWGRVMSEGILNKIPDKANSNIFAVYTEYDGDYKGGYTFLIGAKVKSDSKIPADMVSRKIPAGRFAIFITEKGPVEQVVPSAWKNIWAIPLTSAGGDRAYKADYEVYDQRASDPKNSQIEIHIGIK
jgi:predicted transcriptional regulator YdeE